MKRKYKILMLFTMMILFLLPSKQIYAQSTDTTYHYLAIGNSITKHPITDFWWGEWGMAATGPEQDFVHQVESYLRQYNANVSTQSVYAASWERSSAKSSMLSMFDGYVTSDLDLVTIQLGENVLDNTNAEADLQNLVSYIQQRAPRAQIIMVGSFWENNLYFDAVKRNVAASYGLEYVDLSAIRSWRVGVGTVVSGADGSQHVITNQAVGEHPSNAAMTYIAQGIIGKIYNPTAVDYSAVYDFEHYMAYNQDLAGVYGNNPNGAFVHFLQYGMSEGRRASRQFDLATYKNSNRDLLAAYCSDNKQYYLHYINYGKAEGRVAHNSAVGITVLGGTDYSAVYNYQYYMKQNPDVAAVYPDDDVAVLKHFVNYGMNEGRQGSANFSVGAYRALYKDLRQAFGNDLRQYYMHYMNCGKNEGRTATGSSVITDGITVYNGVDYAAVYDYQYYIKQNPDIAKAFPNDDIATLKHFVDYGMSEGRQGSTGFNVKAYCALYKDLRQVYGKDNKQYYMHYLMYGKAEGRKGTGSTTVTDGITIYNGVDYAAVYNYQYYIKQNPDIAKAFPNDDVSALEHFVNFGMSEGRQASANFNVLVYRVNYPDLQVAFGGDLRQYYLHYISAGKKEGRNATSRLKLTDPREAVEEETEELETDTEQAQAESVTEEISVEPETEQASEKTKSEESSGENASNTEENNSGITEASSETE